MSKITLVYPYYENPGMLSIQLAHWESYPPDLWDLFEVAVIDDGSPLHPASEVIGPRPVIPLKLWRIQENIPWNQHGARNLGAKVNKADWLLFTDMDLVLDADNARRLSNQNLDPKCFYKFGRIKMPAWEPYKQHCNSFLVTRDAYWSGGGYDEDYCGTYGGDGPFVKDLMQRYTLLSFENIVLKYYGRTYVKDSGTNDLDRDGPLRAKYHEVGARKKREGDLKPRNPLRFTWDRLL